MNRVSALGPMQALVHSILQQYEDYNWTVQGFGMIRTYLDHDKRWRLNIWDDRVSVPNVSVIHDHPWHFASYVITGELRNVIYDLVPMSDRRKATHDFVEIVTGEEGINKELKPRPCILEDHYMDVYYPGERYEQERTEIHRTLARRGTVTLNDRSKPTAEHSARVFYPHGQQWVDAKPRAATKSEIYMVISTALSGFANE